MINRHYHSTLVDALARAPAVALLGPRQVGKSTLARQIAAERPSVYLDLERPQDRARLADPDAYLSQQAGKLVVLDEIHRAPEIFTVLRGLIDRARLEGRREGLFLLLGSASLDLLHQSSESLAGRMAYVDMGPIDLLDTGPDQRDRLWVRGGFPDSFFAPTNAISLSWRHDFIRTYLERDIPQFGFQLPAETLRRLWTMLSHQQGGLLNGSKLAQSLGVSSPTVARYMDLLVDLLLVRRLLPWHKNTKKRLVKSPKIYVRDSGLVHALLGVNDFDDLLGHPVVGGSWEGFVIETIASACALRSGQMGFYRSSGGAEIDLIIQSGRQTIAIEIKRSTAPKLSRGFVSACDDISPDQAFLIYPGTERFALGRDVEAIGLADLITALN